MLKRRETWRVNKIGPIQPPWGTPQFRLKSSEVLSPTSIRCLRPDRNESNQFKAVPTTPKCCCKIFRRMECTWPPWRHVKTQFITGDCFQPRPHGFCLPFFKGKVLDTRLNCFIPRRASAAHTAELSCTPIAHELRKEEKKMYLVSLDDLRLRRSVRNFNLPPGHTQGIPRAYPGHLTILGVRAGGNSAN